MYAIAKLNVFYSGLLGYANENNNYNKLEL